MAPPAPLNFPGAVRGGGGRGAGAAAGAERPSETCRRRRASLPDPLLLLPLQVTDPCSPTKPAAPFSPESWYRKAYEESRAGSRPAPEGAGSALGSSGTPSPGSGTSSPGSFTGSPGPASPGIGTSSPGSLGGSPGFGTGSPGSGSGGGSSPGSDRGVWCEHCNARLAELKRQALKLLIPGPVSSKVSEGPGRSGEARVLPALRGCSRPGATPTAGGAADRLPVGAAGHLGSPPPLSSLSVLGFTWVRSFLLLFPFPILSSCFVWSKAKQPQLPQLLLIRLLLQTLHQLPCPSLDTLQHLNVPVVAGVQPSPGKQGSIIGCIFVEGMDGKGWEVLLLMKKLDAEVKVWMYYPHGGSVPIVGGPKLNTGFEVRPHQCRVQGHDHFPTPAGHAIFNTSQDAIGFLGYLGTLLAHIQAAVNQHPQVLFCLAAFQPLCPKPVALHGVAVAQVQDLALGLVEPHTIGLVPSIQPVQSLPPLKQINTPTQLGVICKLTEGALDPFIQIIDKDIKQEWPQHRALGDTTCERPPTGFNSIHHHSLGPAIQPVLYPAKSTPVQAMSSQFLQENAILSLTGGRGEVTSKELPAPVWLDNPNSLSLSSQERCFSDHFCGPPLDPLQQLHVLVLRSPELDAVLQPRIRLALWAASAHCRLMSSFSSISTPKAFSAGCSRSHHPPACIETEDCPDPGDPALGLVEPHEVHTGPLLELVQVPLDDSLSFWHVNCTTQLGVICKLAEGALDLAVHVIDENIEQHWSQYGPLRDTTFVDRYPLDVTIQPIPYPLNSPPIKSVSLEFREKDVVGDRILIAEAHYQEEALEEEISKRACIASEENLFKDSVFEKYSVKNWRAPDKDYKEQGHFLFVPENTLFSLLLCPLREDKLKNVYQAPCTLPRCCVNYAGFSLFCFLLLQVCKLYMLSMTPYGVEQPFGQLGSAVPAVSPPSFLCTPSLLAGGDPGFSSVIHDKLQVPNTIRKAWNEKDNRCDVCATHLNQLKQEAIQMVLTLEQAANSEHYDASPGSPPPLSNIPTLVSPRHMGSLQPRDWAYVPAPYATSNYTGFVANKHSGKPNSLGIVNGVEKKNGSSGHQAKVSFQMATSPSNGNVLNSVAIQAHQYLDGTWSLSRTNGVTLYPYQAANRKSDQVQKLRQECALSEQVKISQLMTETSREGLTEAALNRYNADKPSLYSFPASQSTYVASEVSTGTSVAASFFA
ncbi:LOW QUALITY PROTEIN: hypothetical protein QYF61_011472, partial [Mycteria americana]